MYYKHFNILFQKKTTRVLISLGRSGFKEKYIAKIARLSQTEYAYVHKVLNIFEQEGLVKSVKVGRKRKCELTPAGQAVFSNIAKILALFRKEQCKVG
jgi:DNA-binding MarR family transcriptional regulator